MIKYQEKRNILIRYYKKTWNKVLRYHKNTKNNYKISRKTWTMII